MLTTGSVVEDKLKTYESARRLATQFLLRQMNDDGSIGPVHEGVYYCRVPWALALTGETAAAMRVLAWIRQHMLTPEGEVAGRRSPNANANRGANTYAETCLAFGAQFLRQYDVARRALSFATLYQDPATGGVYLDRERVGPNDAQVLYLTCQLGMSAVLTGRHAEALAAGHFLRRLWEAQPELPDRLYTISTRSGGLAILVPPDADRRHYVNESQEVQQYHYNGGMAAAFLVQLSLASGDARWLDLAREYQTFSMGSTPRQFEVKQVCKSAWGSALLYAATREPIYRDWTLRLGDWFVANQFPDGHWVNSEYLDPTPTIPRIIAITAEFLVHLDTIIGQLAVSYQPLAIS